MSTLRHLRSGLEHTFDHLAEGWDYLTQRATQALTRFSPGMRSAKNVETADEQISGHASRWGLLAAEVREDGDEIIVKIEAPGMEPNDFDIDVSDDMLLIRGEKHVQKTRREGRYHAMECAYGSFERAVPLPCAVAENGAKAKYRRGVLSVTLPKLPSAKTRRIQVNAT